MQSWQNSTLHFPHALGHKGLEVQPQCNLLVELYSSLHMVSGFHLEKERHAFAFLLQIVSWFKMEYQFVPPGGDKNNGPTREAVYGLFLSIAFVVVGLRFYVRAWMLKILWWDDFFLLVGLVRRNIIVCTQQCANCSPSFSPPLCSASSSLAYSLDLGDMSIIYRPRRQVVLTCWTKSR